jgi:tRNA(fMet)-specific endonuclease VapC
MRYLLDSNFCIGYMRGRIPRMRQRLAAVSVADVFLCAPVKAELVYGAIRSAASAMNLLQVSNFAQPFSTLPFDDLAAERFARVRRDLEVQGAVIGPYDMQIAAIALVNACTLVTHNTREFGRVPGLALDDWEL